MSSELGSWLLWLFSAFIAGVILGPSISGMLSTWKSSLLESKFWTLVVQLGHQDHGASAPPLDSDKVQDEQQVITSTLPLDLDSNISQGSTLTDDEDSRSYHSVDSNISEVNSLCKEDTVPVHFLGSNNSEVVSSLCEEDIIAPAHSVDSNNSEEGVDFPNKQAYRYDVFLSFRGADVRYTFLAHLYKYLIDNGFATFMDEEWIERGDGVYPELMNAIIDSRLAIVVFSKEYPTSTWCLNEMSAIADRCRQKKQIVFPVFYDVTASDVGHRTGEYEKHFKSEKMSRNPQETVDRWKTDLEYLAKLHGFPIVDHLKRPQTEHLDKIILDVAEKLKHQFKLITSDLIGIRSRVAELERRLKLTSNDIAFQILEIWGMSGTGKTVLATYLYDRICRDFEASCFILGVDGLHKRHGNETATQMVQKQILTQIFPRDEESDDPNEIIKRIQNRLCSENLRKRTLIVLDDVGDPKQWDDLRIVPSLLGEGSRVVITTRLEHILNVNAEYEIHEVQPLSHDEARELFQRTAFRIDCLSPTFSGLSHEIIEYSECLPSAIVKLGYYLNQNAEELLERCLQRWREYPEKNYMNSLQEKSYEVLNEGEQKIFLDIACFFAGKGKEYVEHILESRISYSYEAIQEIRRKSLIKITNNEIHMHQILQDLGKKIVRGNNEKEPKLWSRLWDKENFQEVLIDMEENKVEAIVLDEDVSEYLNTNGLTELRGLRLFILHHHESSSESLTFGFHKLCYLSWHGFSYISLSLGIWSNLVELNLPDSSIQQLWEGRQEIPKLKRMNLRNSRNLRTTPSFERCRGLVRLDLTGCTNLTEVHDSIGLLRKLDYLSLRDCSSLALLDFGAGCQLSSLRTLLLSGCTNLSHMPDVTRLSNLRYLDLERCTSLSTVHNSIGEHSTLRYLSLRGCTNLVPTPYIVNGNSSLLILDLSGCMMITNLTHCIRKFAPSSCLESLVFLSPDFLEPRRTLDFLNHCSKLTYLNLAHCDELRRFAEVSFHGLHDMKGTLERNPQLTIIGQDYIFSSSTV